MRDTETTVSSSTTTDYIDISLADSHNMCSEIFLAFQSTANIAAGHYYDFSGNENSNPAVADCVDTLAPALAAWPIQALHLQHCGLNDGHGPKLGTRCV